ncbi:hypothetical protein Bbelb_399990 [Branchiostoma belcheri]|nr:hypothetical protein Bbelb_399990 [Branchiostoma belcheri]
MSLSKEEQRLNTSDFSNLLNKDTFHRSLLACSVEVIMTTYGVCWTPMLYTMATTDTNTSFPWILDVFELKAYDFFKVLETFILAEPKLTKEVIKVSPQKMLEWCTESEAATYAGNKVMAAALTTLETQFSEELSCSICLELFTRPKMLPGQHTFCQDCLQDHAGRRGTFHCPNCRQQSVLSVVKKAMMDIQPQALKKLHRKGPAVFEPTDTPMPVLGHVTVQSLPSAPIPAAPAARGTNHHHPPNQRRGEHQPQRVTFGREGSGTGQFQGPRGVTVSDEGKIFVADRWNYRIQVFTLQGTFVHQFPTVVSGTQKMYPRDVAMDGEGNLWVVGSKGSTEFAVQYTKQGRVLRKFDLQKSRLDRGVAVNTRKNHILITQTTGNPNNRHGEVQVFRPDGKLVKTVGGKFKNFVRRRQGMKHPGYITVDREGNFLVSDGDSNCVFLYDEDRQIQFQFGGEGRGEGQLRYPRGICTDRAGNIIVADGGNRRVEMFDKTGTFLKHIATDMESPQAVAMATQGQLVVTDNRNQTVTIFQNY